MQTLSNCGPTWSTLTDKFSNPSTGNVAQYDSSGHLVAGTWTNTNGNLTVSNGTVVVLTPATYCVASLTIKGTLQVSSGVANGSLPTVVIVDGSIDMNAGALVNNSTRDAQNMQVISTYGNDPSERTSPNVTVNGGTAAYITVYAPTTGVKITGNGDIYGAVMSGKNVAFSGNTNVYYDQYLGSGSASLVDIVEPVPTTTSTTTTITIVATVPGPTLWNLASWQRLGCKRESSAWTCQ